MLGFSAFFRDMLNISIEAGARDVATEHLPSNVLPARALLWAAVSGDLRAAMQLEVLSFLTSEAKTGASVQGRQPH